MEKRQATEERIRELLGGGGVTLFMKGDRDEPRCGFSATVVRILDALIPDYRTVDVLEDAELREGIKAYSNWPTIPQLYIGEEFIGGCDIVQELEISGELYTRLGVEKPLAPAAPRFTLTPAAAEGLRRATASRPPEHRLQLSVDARFFSSLGIGPAIPGGVDVEIDGLPFTMDPLTATRAHGLTIDAVDTPQGLAFRIDNPNAPQRVQSMDVRELKRRLDAGESFEFVDVRSPEERAIASIPGARLLTQELAQRLEALPRDTRLVFHCHHGMRSQQAAEHFAALGFTDVWNVEGGVDAWSREIDPDVPRY